jgi:hypothetical protein
LGSRQQTWILTPSPGVSIPAVTIKLDSTKHDIRNGRKTGSPVSANSQYISLTLSQWCIPGCRVESTIFFAFHNSSFISATFPCLYPAMTLFACSNPALVTSSVLFGLLALLGSNCANLYKSNRCTFYWYEQNGPSSPRIGYIC